MIHVALKKRPSKRPDTEDTSETRPDPLPDNGGEGASGGVQNQETADRQPNFVERLDDNKRRTQLNHARELITKYDPSLADIDLGFSAEPEYHGRIVTYDTQGREILVFWKNAQNGNWRFLKNFLDKTQLKNSPFRTIVTADTVLTEEHELAELQEQAKQEEEIINDPNSSAEEISSAHDRLVEITDNINDKNDKIVSAKKNPLPSGTS